MVSPLWNASSEGDTTQVQLLLTEASPIDIEIKDGSGATPLVQAVKNGHAEVVRALLDAGADLSNPSSEEGLEQLTTDATILEFLDLAKEKRTQLKQNSAVPYQPENYQQEYTNDPSKSYYVQPQGSYMYYPSIHPGAAMLPDGSPAPYYAPPSFPPSGQPPSDGNGGSNLPPPEIARLIPCRFYPACRYGPSCIFAHPQGPYFQGPLPPPAQYAAPYDPMGPSPYANGYYPVPPQGYVPNGMTPASVNPMSPPQVPAQPPTPQQNHARNISEVVSPLQVPFAPPPVAQPVPYGMPMSNGYPAHGPLPPIPVGMSPLPPPQQPMAPAPHANGVMYHPSSPVIQTQAHRRNSSVAHPQNGVLLPGVSPEASMNLAQPLTPHQDGFMHGPRPQARDNAMHARRGSVRRLSTMGPSRKPPCLFFPSGRCRNGDSCRFPHVLPENADQSSVVHYPQKPGPRPRPSPLVTDTLEEKMNGLSLRSVSQNPLKRRNFSQLTVKNQEGNNDTPQPNGHPVPLLQPNGNRSVAQYKASHLNGARSDKRNGVARPAHPQQRIPSADDFPVLAGSTTPPSRSPGISPLNGPTAAQVLQAPPPVRRDSARSSTHSQGAKGTESPSQRVASPQSSPEQKASEAMNGSANHINGINGPSFELNSKPPTFASIASPSGPEVANAVSVSA